MSKILLEEQFDVENFPYLSVDLLLDDATIFNGVHALPGETLYAELAPGVRLRFTYREED